jgi:glycosyltransferase involved in cell wall biosynthesis
VVTLVENGVDLSLFTGEHSVTRGPREGARFAFVGRLVDWKRVDLLIQAMAKIAACYELSIVGEGPMRPSLEAQVTQLGLDGRVTFHGQLSQKQCAEVLARCDALVLPSILECGGAVVLEAMAMGLPVIATNWGGPQDYLDDGETGILVEPSEPEVFVEGLSRALVRLGESPELRAKLGSKGRERVEREFDWERKIDRILGLYAQVAFGMMPEAKPARLSVVEQVAGTD